MTSPMQDIRDLTGGDWAYLVSVVGGPENVLRIKRGELAIVLKEVKRCLHCDVVFDTASFLHEDWKLWRGPAGGTGLEGDIDRDDRSLLLKEIDWVKVKFEYYPQDGETLMTGEERLQFQRQAGHIRFGGNVFISLWRDYQINKGKSVLEMLYTGGHKIDFLEFLGLILRNSEGQRCAMYLYRGGGWSWGYNLLNSRCGSHSVYGIAASER